MCVKNVLGEPQYVLANYSDQQAGNFYFGVETCLLLIEFMSTWVCSSYIYMYKETLLFLFYYFCGWVSYDVMEKNKVDKSKMNLSRTEGYWSLFCVFHSQLALWCKAFFIYLVELGLK